jgi:hypothetical protein
MANKVLLIVIAMIFVVGSAYAEMAQVDPASVFSFHQKEILSQSLTIIDGIVFSVGRTESLTKSTSSKNIAKKKAAFIAKSQLAELSVLDVIWPAAFTEKQKRYFVKIFLANALIELSVEDLTAIDEGRLPSGAFYSVIGVSEKSVQVQKVGFQQLKDSVRSVVLSRKVSPLTYFEYCDSSDEQKVKIIVFDYLEREYGVNIGAVLHLRPVDEMPELWVKGKDLSVEAVSSLNLNDLLRFASMNPYDPVVLYYLGLNLEGEGHSKLANLFFERGSLWFIDDTYQEKCFLESQQPESNITFSRGRLYQLRNEYFGDVGYRETLSINPLESKIIQSMGTIPVLSLQVLIGDSKKDKLSIEVTPKFNPEEIYKRGINLWKKRDEIYALPFFIQAYLSSGKAEPYKSKLKMLLEILKKKSLFEEIEAVRIFNG